MHALNPDIQSLTISKRDIQAPGHSRNNVVAINADFILANLLLGNNDVALEALEQDHTIFNFYILNNPPVFDPIRNDPIFKDLVIQKRIEYDSHRVIYGGTEFFDVENSKQSKSGR